MDMFLNRFANFILTCILTAITLLVLPNAARSQAAFDQAQQLVKEWADAQHTQIQAQKLSAADLKKLTEIQDSMSQEVPKLLRTRTLELLNSPGVHSPRQVQQKISIVLHTGLSDEYKPEVFVFRLGAKQGTPYFIAYNVD
jgi:Skp family chaperone for outer membrane proteins